MKWNDDLLLFKWIESTFSHSVNQPKTISFTWLILLFFQPFIFMNWSLCSSTVKCKSVTNVCNDNRVLAQLTTWLNWYLHNMCDMKNTTKIFRFASFSNISHRKCGRKKKGEEEEKTCSYYSLVDRLSLRRQRWLHRCTHNCIYKWIMTLHNNHFKWNQFASAALHYVQTMQVRWTQLLL